MKREELYLACLEKSNNQFVKRKGHDAMSRPKNIAACSVLRYLKQQHMLPSEETDRLSIFPLLLSCFFFYFYKCFPSIKDAEIKHCTVRTCRTLRRLSTGTFRETETYLWERKRLTWIWAVQQCCIIELSGTSGNASHPIGRIYEEQCIAEIFGSIGNAFHYIGRIFIPMLYHRIRPCQGSGG